MVQTATKRNALHELGYKIFLDRYAQKDMTRSTLAVGDTVIVVVNSQSGQREIGRVTAMNLPDVTIELLDGEIVQRSIEHVDKPLETDPAQMMERVARGIASVERNATLRKEWTERFQWLLDDFKFVPAGRILAAAGTEQQLTFYNCFVINSPRDSRAGIIETLRQMTEIMSRGGGVGINLSSLRPRHAYVKGVNGRSSGAVSWGGLYSFVTGLIEQGGSRRGALMLILDDWHPDVFDFINSKRTAGKITNANISVGVSDRLMEAVKADGDWDLVFPDTHHAAYDAEWDGNLEAWIAKDYPVITHRTVKAREIWDSIIESAWASAEPGVFFRERYNKMSNSAYYAPIIATNPCHAGSNLIHTRHGLRTIKDLAAFGGEFEVVSDLRTIGGGGVHYERAIAYPTGSKPVFKVRVDTGLSIKLTGNHNLFTRRGKVAVEDLRIDEDEILIQSTPHLDALLPLDEGQLEKGRIVGWNASDGWVSQFPDDHQGSGVNVGFIFNQQEDFARELVLDYVNQQSSSTRRITARLNKGCWEIQTSNAATVEVFKSYGIAPKTRKRVSPEIAAAPISFRIGFLQGLFSSDGSIRTYRKSKTGQIILVTVNKGLAEGVQILLADLGIKSSLRTRIERGMRYTLESGEVKTSNARQAYSLRINGVEGIRRFARLIGFHMSTAKQQRLDEVLKQLDELRLTHTEYWSKVVSVEPQGMETVYNVTTDISHSLVSNGLVVANCGEQGLPGNAVCNLGAINLAKFYDENTNDVQWDTLDTAVRYATRFLDNVIDATPYFFEDNKQQQLGERRVGLNNMGLAELMIRMGIRYGSTESTAFIDKLYAFMTRATYETSIQLAQEKGAFPMFDAEKFVQSGFMQTMPDDIREGVRTKGIRNVTLLTQAPNGTIGTMVNTSTGIEPFFSWVYYRKSRLGLHEEQVPLVQEWREAHPDETDLPDYFVTAMDLTPEEHVEVQAAIQRWVDSSISKTSNLPNHYTVEQTRKLYEYMYELGCKGGTIYRDGSRDEQVLMLKGDERAEKEAAEKAAPASIVEVATPHHVYPRPKKLHGVTVNMKTPYGTAYITMNSDDNGYPFEVFITAPGKAGSDLQADAEGLGRMISLQLRTTAPANRLQMIKLVIDQLQGIGGSRSIGMGPNRVLSLPDAVAGALNDHYFPADKAEQLSLFTPPELMPSEVEEVDPPLLPANSIAVNAPGNGNGHAHETTQTRSGAKLVSGNGYSKGAEMCPSCGTVSLIRAEGCRKCLSCGYSEC
jgi:ribonucleoside-diphosphate reductase alpha chain